MNIKTTEQFSLTTSEIAEFTDNLRHHDKAECRLLYPEHSIHTLLAVSLDTSRGRLMTTLDGKPMALGGVADFPGAPGFLVWMVGTQEADKLRHQLALYRIWQNQLGKWLPKYQRLSNYCSADEGQLRVMKSLGFDVYEVGVENVRFISLCV